VKRWLTEFDAKGVEKAVTFASLPQEMPTVAEALKLASGRLIGYTLVNPLAPNAAKFVADAADKGFRGILLFPVMHRFDASSKEAQAVYEVAASKKMVIVVHFGLLSVKLRDLLGLPRPFDLSFGNPLSLQVAANAHSNAWFIIPHFGCGFFRETLMLGSQCENVCVDSSSSNSWMATQLADVTLKTVFAKARNVFGAERLLFGTDSSTFPRGWREDLYTSQQLAMVDAQFTDDEQQKVFAGNIERLLKL
jgi:predicted TIM-barrel fold metal-dependent hydrolase